MEQGVSRLLLKEKRRRRLMFGAVALGVAVIAISTRSERAMFGVGLPMPGVFATISTPLAGAPRASLHDRDPSAFFAGLDHGVNAPAGPIDNGAIGQIDSALLFVGPGDGLPPGRLGPPDIIGPDIIGDPQPYREPPPSDPPYIPEQKKPTTGPSGPGPNPNPDPNPNPGPGPGPGPNPDPGPGPNPDPGPGPGPTTPPIDPHPPTHTAVPEPATWALMITGFLAIGAMMRRRKAKELGVALSNQN